MIIDLRKDARDIYNLLVNRLNEYVTKAEKSQGPVSAVGIAYEFGQRGWVIVHFDNRPEHKRDGHMIYQEKEVFKRPHWFASVKALAYFDPSGIDEETGRTLKKKPVTLILPNGTRKNTAKMSEKAFSAILGKLIKDVLFLAKKKKLFDKLPKHESCQLDIEEFNGTWAWPAYEELGKKNCI